MYRSFASAAALATVSALATGPARAQVFVSPLVIETSPGIVTVANAGAQPIRIGVEAADFDQDATGRVLFAPLGRSPHSCGSRLQVGEAPTQVAPHAEIRLSVTVEPGSAPCWGGVLLHLSTGLAPGARVGLQVYAVPSGAPRSAAVAGVAVAGDSLRAEVINDGPTPLRPHGRFEVRTAQGETIASYDVPAFGLHPGVRRSITVPRTARTGQRFVSYATGTCASGPRAATVSRPRSPRTSSSRCLLQSSRARATPPRWIWCAQ